MQKLDRFWFPSLTQYMLSTHLLPAPHPHFFSFSFLSFFFFFTIVALIYVLCSVSFLYAPFAALLYCSTDDGKFTFCNQSGIFRIILFTRAVRTVCSVNINTVCDTRPWVQPACPSPTIKTVSHFREVSRRWCQSFFAFQTDWLRTA